MQTRSSQASAQPLGQDDLILETPPPESQSASGLRAPPLPGLVSEDDIRQLQARLLQAQIAEVEARIVAIATAPAAPLASTNPGKKVGSVKDFGTDPYI